MQSNVCNIRPVFLFLTAHHFSLAKQQHLHQDVHPQQQTTKSEQITMTEAIYRLQRATVASWHCLACHTKHCVPAVPARTCSEGQPSSPSVYELGLSLPLRADADQDTHCLIDLAAELKSGSLQQVAR